MTGKRQYRSLLNSGYWRVWCPGHPVANKDGYALEHRKVAWDHGILTNRRHHVHHVNGDKLDNRPENLEALGASEHHRHHIAEAGVVENQFGVWAVVPGETPAIRQREKRRADKARRLAGRRCEVCVVAIPASVVATARFCSAKCRSTAFRRRAA